MRRTRLTAAAGFLLAVGGGIYLYAAPLITIGRKPGGGALHASALTTGDRFLIIYGGLGMFLAAIGLAGSFAANRAGFAARWVSALALCGVALLAFLATFGEPRLSAVFVPAAVLMLLAAGTEPASRHAQ